MWVAALCQPGDTYHQGLQSFQPYGGIETPPAEWYVRSSGVSPVGASVESIVEGPDNSLIVGGNFNGLGGVSSSCIARFNLATNTWGSFGPANYTVTDFAWGNALYVAGFFSSVGGVSTHRLAQYYDTDNYTPGPTPTHTHTPTKTATPNYTATAYAGATETVIAIPTQTAWAATQTANAPTPTPGPIYLPLSMRNYSPCTGKVIDETEPNDIVADANEVCLGARVRGKHDGATGTGDLFKLWLAGGQQLQASLDTDSGASVQLLLYRQENGSPVQLLQDTSSPFVLDYAVTASGWYYVYVYSDKSANNSAGYELHLADAGVR